MKFPGLHRGSVLLFLEHGGAEYRTTPLRDVENAKVLRTEQTALRKQEQGLVAQI